MQWSSLAEFLAMGGYGLYVWGAYAATAVVIAAEVAVLVRRGRTLREQGSRSPHVQSR
jgi:heme exporter protein D